ncbi:MAG: hypothetical protein HLUCCX10_14315 [Algoriphagus marincola HL-49]|uniref:Uncharacterized protein n=1 Tax=Algoriphagus marincola HL-49 TaxID=1305737 RepID=A0A0P7Y675_9BACT|nr:MAG: hypothetical protein HLUCCX10_14315 [Algoriphagus marincola HL-49]
MDEYFFQGLLSLKLLFELGLKINGKLVGWKFFLGRTKSYRLKRQNMDFKSFTLSFISY